MTDWKERISERVNRKIPVTISAGRNSAMEGHILKTKDISSHGVFIYSEKQFPVGSNVFVRMLLPSGRRTICKGLVWRNNGNGMAVRFDHICNDIVEEFGEKAVGNWRHGL
mgnify:CR=1 FL=1